jgi:uroporphyrinogen-III synthase
MGMAKQSTEHGVPVLLTRPAPASAAFGAAVAERFGQRVRIVIAPLMATEFLVPALPKGAFVGVIFTSATGVTAAQRLGTDLPKDAYCVGAETAARATKAGFRAVSADGDATALAQLIMAHPPRGRLLHLRGEETRGELGETLISAGIETLSAILYRQTPQPLTAEALGLLGQPGPAIAALFSPRSAALFIQALPVDRRARLSLVAISKAAALAAGPGTAEQVLIARQPDAQAMLDAIGYLLETLSPP